MTGGTFKFTWGHPAEEVYVTGTFDNWTKSEKLSKVGDSFEKNVTLPDASKKIYYKFVVDNNWITDHTAPQEPDHEGNVNNFLTPEQIVKENPTAAIMNTITPESTTAALAKDVPLENSKASEEEPKATPVHAIGGFPQTPVDELDKTISVNPLPASDVTKPQPNIAPGEPLPPSAHAGDIHSQVTLDKESYEKSDRLPGLTEANSTLPSTTGADIPESSLPMPAAAIAAGIDTTTINTVTPEATTAALAANVPKTVNAAALDAKVPEAVVESQKAAGVDPEASADPKEVIDKATVEDELKEKVPEAPSTSEGTAGFGTQKSENAGIAATAITAGGIALAAAASVAAAGAATNLPEAVKEKLPESVQETIKSQAREDVRQEVAPTVPSEVKESIIEAGKAPEAAASTSAVQDKAAVESELLQEVKAVPAVGEDKSKTEEVKTDSAVGAAPVLVTAEVKQDAAAAVAAPAAITPSAPKVDDVPAASNPALHTAPTPVVTDGPSTTSAAVKSEPESVAPATEAKTETAAAEDKAEESKAVPTKEGDILPNGANAAAPAEPVKQTTQESPATPAKAEASGSTTTPSTSSQKGTEQKKKNRLSAFIGKLKSKVHSKD
ncbi:Diphosphoinositol polyphosphate phosphohydrolase DDP1 [Verticillium dahliae VDG1]|nr:Diphosphoinositol polyphosphate phosphohydrolase DDP1 [Verticillium dahliae VDG1]